MTSNVIIEMYKIIRIIRSTLILWCKNTIWWPREYGTKVFIVGGINKAELSEKRNWESGLL